MRASEPRPCRNEDCDTRVILARRMPAGLWRAYEAQDRPPFSQEATWCHVLVNDQAWTPRDLMEDVMVRNEITEEKARELVAGHPWHRPHFHPPEDTR